MIRTQDLTKTYGELHAIENLTLELDEATCSATSGPTAPARQPRCGSSPRFCSRLGRSLTSAVIRYTQTQGIRRLIGYMPDFFGVYDDMKVIEYLEFFAAAYRIKGPQRRKICDQCSNWSTWATNARPSSRAFPAA